MNQPPAQPDPARDHSVDGEIAVELDAHLDDRVARNQVGPLRIADHQVVHFLGAEADPVEVVARGDPAALELLLQDMGRDRAALDPQRRDRGDDDQ